MTTGARPLRRSLRGTPGKDRVTQLNNSNVTPSQPRKSERLNKNSTEEFSSRRKSKRFNAPSSKSRDKDVNASSSNGKKVITETNNFENGKTVRRRLDAKRYLALFVEQKRKRDASEPSEGPMILEKLPQSDCHAIDSREAEENQQITENKSERKRRKKSKSSFENPDLSNGITPEAQVKEVINVDKNEPSEQNVDCKCPASKCESMSVELDCPEGTSLKVQSEYVSSSSLKEGPSDCDAEIHTSELEDISPLSLHDSRGSKSHVESDKVEEDSGTQVKLDTSATISRQNLLRVDIDVEDDEENQHLKDAEDLEHCDASRDSTQVLGFDSAHVSRSWNEVNDLSGRCASSPRRHRFVEYWVPARLSNLQLEQYCSALLSNSMSLRSSSKNDPVGALRNLLFTLRQTCSHPFLVDRSLSSSLLKDFKVTEYLDVGIKASGKLQLLDTILLEMRKRGLRVLILYESIDGRDGIGDILDDFLRQRYGQNSYERVDGGGLIPSKKQAVLNKFNDKESGRFVFLLETHACLPSIKLSSVDAIIIHNNDWNPVNDIRALQKVVIDSQHDPIKVFRLFLPQTVEENAMILAKHNVTLDNSMYNISQSNKDKLLINGASDLFDQLEKFHCVDAPVSTMISSLESKLLQDVVQELMQILLQSGRQMGDGLSVCLKVQPDGEDPDKYQLVSDELKSPLSEEKRPQNFWSKLLEGRNPSWKFVSIPNRRNRKRVQYDESADVQFNDTEDVHYHKSEDVVKKCRKVVHDSSSTDVISALENQEPVASDIGSRCDEQLSQSLFPSGKTGIADDGHIPSDVLNSTAVKSGNMVEESKEVYDNDTPKSLLLMLKPELRKLCELLNMHEDVINMADRFLEYVMENHRISREPLTLLQAFQLSVIWIAASLTKQKIDDHESLDVARQHLKFCCNEDDTDLVYLKMGLFKELFIQSFAKDKANDLACSRVVDHKKLMVKIIKQINKKCRQRFEILRQKHLQEIEQLQKSIDEEKAQLEQDYKTELALVHTIHVHNPSIAADKVNEIECQFSKRLEEHCNNKNIRLKSLEHKHLSERDKENELTSGWKEDIVKEQLEILRKLSHSDIEKSERDEHLMVHDGPKGGPLPCNQPANSVDLIPDKEVPESSSRDALPTRLSTSVLADTPSSENTLGAPIASKELSLSADLISGNGLLNSVTIDGVLSHSNDDAVGNQHESEAPSTDPIEFPSSQANNALPPSQLNVEGLTTEGQSEVLISTVTPCSEQSDPCLQLDRSLLHTPTNYLDVAPSNAEQSHQLPRSPLVGSSSRQPSSSPTMLEVQQSRGHSSTPNAGALNYQHIIPSPLPSAVNVSCMSPTNIAISQSASLPGPAPAISDFASSLNLGRTITSTVSSQVQFSYLDPLHGELERIQQEADHSIKIYEDMKQQLNRECEKEIEEMVAKIRKKYETKKSELDAAFICKKKELDSNHKKVYLNRMLAEAFRRKCMDLKVSASPGMSQANMQGQVAKAPHEHAQRMVSGPSPTMQTSGTLQATHNLMHIGTRTGPSPSSAPSTSRNLQPSQNPLGSGHPAAPSRFSPVQTSGIPQNTQNTTYPVAALPRYTPSSSPVLPSTSQYLTTPLRNSLLASPTIEATASRPIQIVNNCSALFSGNSSRPVSTPPPTVNLHSSSGYRAPPPHLRRSTLSQPMTPNTSLSAYPPIPSLHGQYSNVRSELEKRFLDRAANFPYLATDLSSGQPTQTFLCLSDDE